MVLRWLTLLLAAIMIQPPNNPVQFTVPGISVPAGNTIDLPVSIQTNGNSVGSLEFALNYNQSILEFNKITVSEQAQKWLTYTMDGGNGKVRWGGYDTTFGDYSIVTPTELFIVTFRVLDYNWTETPITVGRKTAGDVEGWDIPVLNTDGYINLDRSINVDEDGIYGKAYPIPTSDRVSIQAIVPQSGQYEVLLYDIKGNLLKATNVIFIRGTVNIEESLQQYHSGVYLLQIKNEKFIKTFKLVKN